jgi:N,N'-diacetyllegionaminate synthase
VSPTANATTLSLGDRLVGPGKPCLVIAEVAQTHDGSLGLAHSFIDAVAARGVDAIKFQTHIAAAESTPSEPFRVPFSWQDDSRYDYWARTSFTEAEWRTLATHARERGLIFLSSPFSVEAVDLLERVGVPAWKIGSGECTNLPLLERVAATRLPIILSTGLSGFAELDDTVGRLRGSSGGAVAVLQCTSAYPVAPEQLGLNLITEFRHRYGPPVGLSDHSGTIFPGLAAVALGASIVEVHVAFDREQFGPDVAASITMGELANLVEGIRFIETALAHPVDKDVAASELAPLRKLFTRSIVWACNLDEGAVVQEWHLSLKKPGTGMPPARLPSLIGRRTRRRVHADELLSDEDLA